MPKVNTNVDNDTARNTLVKTTTVSAKPASVGLLSTKKSTPENNDVTKSHIYSK